MSALIILPTFVHKLRITNCSILQIAELQCIEHLLNAKSIAGQFGLNTPPLNCGANYRCLLVCVFVLDGRQQREEEVVEEEAQHHTQCLDALSPHNTPAPTLRAQRTTGCRLHLHFFRTPENQRSKNSNDHPPRWHGPRVKSRQCKAWQHGQSRVEEL